MPNLTYNESQKKAIQTIHGPVLIIAGPGTGKTFTLVERVIYMVSELAIDPSEILISTFTNKAALELLDRLSLQFKNNNLKKDINDMFIGNFHSICRKILEKYIVHLDLKAGYKVIDEVEKAYLIHKHLERFKAVPGYHSLIGQNEVKEIADYINLVFEEGILERRSNNPTFQTILDLASVYEAIAMEKNVLDFSMHLYLTYKLLKEKPQVAEELRQQIRYLMIDEYQDTNSIQEKILFELKGQDENICVVGDDDQGLYRFRGASVKNILEFPKKMQKPTQIIHLDINYRSTSDIVAFYTDYIEELNVIPNISHYRYSKKLNVADGQAYQSIYKLSASNDESFRDKILNSVKMLKGKGLINHYNELAILVSSVNEPRILRLKTALKRAGIGVYTPTTKTLLQRREIHYLIGAYYAFFQNHLKNAKIDIQTARFLENSYGLFYKQMQTEPRLETFVGQMQEFISEKKWQLHILDLPYRLFRYPPFKDLLEDDQNLQAKKNISRFLELIHSFSLMEGIFYINQKNVSHFVDRFFASFLAFLKAQKVGEFEEETVVPNDDTLSLMTIHAAKGMEYPVVIMASLWDRHYPKSYQRRDEKIKESFLEAFGSLSFEPFQYINKLDFYKKYYTGFSRAKNILILAGIDDHKKQAISADLYDLFKSLPNLDSLNPSAIRTEEPKDHHIKKVYAYTSDIVAYQACPRAYHFFRQLRYQEAPKASMTYGSLVHEGIDYINKAFLDGKIVQRDMIDEYISQLARAKKKDGALYLNDYQIEKARQDVYRYLEAFGKDSLFDQSKILDSELGISLARSNFILTGHLDMVYQGQSGPVIVDFKTGKNPSVNRPDLLEQYLKQLYFYSYLYEQTKDDKVEEVVLYFPSELDEQIISSKVDQKKVDEVKEMVEQTIQAIELDKSFAKTDNKALCKSCDLRFFCDRIEDVRS